MIKLSASSSVYRKDQIRSNFCKQKLCIQSGAWCEEPADTCRGDPVEPAAGDHRVPGPQVGRLQRRQQAKTQRSHGAGVGAARPLSGWAEHGGGPGGPAAALASHSGGTEERSVCGTHLTQVSHHRRRNIQKKRQRSSLLVGGRTWMRH